MKRYHPAQILNALASEGIDLARIRAKNARFIRSHFKEFLGTFPKYLLERIATKLDRGDVRK
jgi:hypothetical protein